MTSINAAFAAENLIRVLHHSIEKIKFKTGLQWLSCESYFKKGFTTGFCKNAYNT